MKTFFLLFLLLFFCVNADEVRLKNKSVLIGEIDKIHKGRLHIKTDFAGTLVIDCEKIEYYKTDSEVTYRAGDKKAVRGLYDSRKQPVISTLWRAEDPNVFKSTWDRKIWADFVRRTGNSTSSSLSGGFKFQLNREYETLKLYGRFIRNKRKEIRTADERSFGFDFEKRFDSEMRHSAYLRAEFEKDRVEGLNLRSTYGAGYGYYFIKTDKTKLRGRIGALYREETYYEDDSQSSLAVDTGILFKQSLYNDMEWYTEVTYSPAFDATGNYRIVHESGIEIPLKATIDLKLNSGVEHTYNSEPAETRQALDTRYFMRLIFGF